MLIPNLNLGNKSHSYTCGVQSGVTDFCPHNANSIMLTDKLMPRTLYISDRNVPLLLPNRTAPIKKEEMRKAMTGGVVLPVHSYIPIVIHIPAQ